MMKRIRAKILSLTLVVVMLVGMVPTMALATDETTPEQQMSMVTNSDLIKAQEDYIYLGRYPQSLYTPQTLPESPAEDTDYTDEDGTRFVYLNGNYYKYEPIKWRVLSNDTTNKQLLLVADQILDVTQYHTSASAVAYKNSSIQEDWFYAFSRVRYLASAQYVAYETQIESTSYGGEYRTYPLAVSDIENTSYFADSERKKADSTAYATAKGSDGSWWLRTGISTDSIAPYVTTDGGSGSAIVTSTHGVRPAMILHCDFSDTSYNADRAAVVFFHEVGKKISGEIGNNCLASVDPRSGNEWEANVQLLGSSSTSALHTMVWVLQGDRNGETITEAYAEPGKTFSFYWRSYADVDDYVSALLADVNGNVLYYGRIAQITEDSYYNDGTADLVIPSDCPDGEYTLFVFNERKHSSNLSDYVSCPREVKLTIKKDAKYDIAIDALPAVEGLTFANPNPSKSGETVTLTANPSESQHLSSWEVKDGANSILTVSRKTYGENGVATNTFTMPTGTVTATPTYATHEYVWDTPRGSEERTGRCSVCGYTLNTVKREVNLGADIFTDPVDTNTDAELYDYKPTSHLYFGSYDYLGHGTVRPVLWRVLDAEKM